MVPLVGFGNAASAFTLDFRMAVFFGEMGVEGTLAGEALATGLTQVRLHELMLHQQVKPSSQKEGRWIILCFSPVQLSKA